MKTSHHYLCNRRPQDVRNHLCRNRRKETLILELFSRFALIRVCSGRFLRAALLSLSISAVAQLNPGNPLANLEKLKDYQTMRTSSSDADWKNGNGDAR